MKRILDRIQPATTRKDVLPFTIISSLSRAIPESRHLCEMDITPICGSKPSERLAKRGSFESIHKQSIAFERHVTTDACKEAGLQRRRETYAGRLGPQLRQGGPVPKQSSMSRMSPATCRANCS